MEKEILNSLEYNPNLKRKEKIRGSFDIDYQVIDDDQGSNEVVTITEPEDILIIGTGLVTDNISNFLELEKRLNILDEKVYKELKYVDTFIPKEYIQDIKDIKEELGLIPGPINIDDYIYGLDHLEDPRGALIVELWENYHEDINGNLKAELYGDIHEIKNEINHFKDYMKLFIIENIKVDNHIELDYEKSNFLDLLKQQEKLFGIESRNIIKNNIEVQEMFINSFIENKDNLDTLKEIKYSNKLRFEKNKFRNYSIEESNKITEIKSIQLESLITELENNIDRESFKDKNEINSIINVRGETIENSIPYLHKMNLLVKLGVDNDNQEKHKIKNTIRNIFSINNKEKLMNELLVEEEVFQKSALDTIHYISFYDDLYNNSADVFLNQSTKALKQMIEDKKNKTREFYNIEESESYFRELKIKNVLGKDDGRQTYKEIKRLIK